MDGQVGPLSIVVAPANVNDHFLLEETIEAISDYFISLAHYIGIGDCARQPLIHRNNNIL